VVPVDEDMTDRREDVGGAPYRKEMVFLSCGGEKRKDKISGGFLYSV